jgi:UDP-glucose 4-epimerase
MSPSHVVVTGAGGFVGSSLAIGFQSLGWQVTAVDRAFDADACARLAGMQFVELDLAAETPRLGARAALIVHAAAITTDHVELGWTASEHVAANLRPLQTMLDLASVEPPDAFVFVSSTGVFAPEDGGHVLADVDIPTGRTPYAVAKQIGETMTVSALEGITDAHVVRLGYVYGPHEVARASRSRVSVVAQWIAAAREGRPLPIRIDDPARDWTYAPDLAPALARLVSGPARPRAVHLGSPFVIRDRGLAAIVAQAFPGVTCAPAPAPGPQKPPMWPSTVPALADFAWTEPATAIARIAAVEVTA